LRRLQRHEQGLNVISREQFGFRKHQATTDQVFGIIEQIITSFNWKKHTEAVFLDVAKAFDKLYHQGLFHKVIEAGFPIGLAKIFRSHMQNKT
jgi:hypothetical protein